MQNTLFWGPFCSNLGKNKFSTKIEFRHFLASIVPKTSCKTSEKTDEPLLIKTLNGRTNERMGERRNEGTNEKTNE